MIAERKENEARGAVAYVKSIRKERSGKVYVCKNKATDFDYSIGGNDSNHLSYRRTNDRMRVVRNQSIMLWAYS